MHPSILNPRTPVLPDALFPHAESAYTFLMRPGVALLAFCLLLMPCAASTAEDSVKDTYEALNALRVNPAAVYEISAAATATSPSISVSSPSSLLTKDK